MHRRWRRGRPAIIPSEVIERGDDNFGTAGRGVLALAWAVAFGPLAVFFFNLSPKTNYHWLWAAFPILQWVFPGATLTCAVVLTRRDTTIWKKVLGWMAVGMSIFLSRGMSDFHGI